MVRLDKSGSGSEAGRSCQRNLTSFVKEAQSFGVSFDVWEARDGDGKHLGEYQWTALPSSDKKQFLQHLPSVMYPTTRECR